MMKIFVRGESCLMSSKIDFFLPAVDTLGYISLQRTNVKYLIAWSNTSETGPKIILFPISLEDTYVGY